VDSRFSGQVAVVTGAGQGIGLEIAKRLGMEGATVIIGDINTSQGEQSAKTLKEDGIRAEYEYIDVTQKRVVDECFAGILKRHETVDVLVNNAGAASITPLLDMSEEQWRTAIGTMLDGTYFCTQAAAKAMANSERGGAIVNISSKAAKTAKPGRAHYSTAKAGIVQLTRASAVDLACYGIRVNSICPGGVAAGMSTYLLEDKEKLEAWNRHVPLGRLGEASEIAAVVAFLASDEASFVTGANIDVDGGQGALGSADRATA